MLLRATTHIGVYGARWRTAASTRTCRRPRFWAQQQVADLRAYLAALADPLDELALHSVLASPLGGLSLDTLVVLAKPLEGARPRRDWRVMTEDEGLPKRPRRPARAAARVLRSLPRRPDDGAAGVARDADRPGGHPLGYDRHLLALSAGTGGWPTCARLMRMAREFEADEGRDLRRFIDFVAERDLVRGGEGQARWRPRTSTPSGS